MVEISERMVKAGKYVLAEVDWDFSYPRTIAKAVYRAMEDARLTTRPIQEIASEAWRVEVAREVPDDD